MFYLEDIGGSGSYDELWDAFPATAVVKGQAQVIQDVFGFWFKDRERAGQEVCFVYKGKQVLADKIEGSGEAILPGDHVYAVVAQNFLVTANPVGAVGVDSYYCGECKRRADENDSRVLIRFDGTRFEENI